jgi:rubredoxin
MTLWQPSNRTTSRSRKLIAAERGARQDAQNCCARGWAALPRAIAFPRLRPRSTRRAPGAKRLAESHYENFHVATWFLPKRCARIFTPSTPTAASPTIWATRWATLRRPWRCSICGARAGRLLRGPRAPSGLCGAGETIRACSIPKEPFADLLSPFARTRPSRATHHGRCAGLLPLLGQSRGPPGALCLRRSERREVPLSDATCSALQLANFWQDVREDYAKGRVYLPQEDMEFFGVSDETIAEGIATPEFRALMRHEVDYARGSLKQGLPLIGMVNRDLALDLDLFSRGGLEILRAIERRDYDVLERAAGHLEGAPSCAGAARRGRQAAAVPAPRPNSSRGRRLDAGSSERMALSRPTRCAGHRRREAKNFYYAFVALPAAPQRHLRHLCLHAPGRRPGRRREPPRDERRRRNLDAWLAHGAPSARAGDSADPVSWPCATPPSASDSAQPARRAGRRRHHGPGPLPRPARPTPTPPSPISTATAIWWPRSWAWSAFASSATPTRAPKSWPRKPASPSSSPTFCAMWPKMRRAIASIARQRHASSGAGQAGVWAPEGMLPSYPSLTFPNHFTIVTGLYPEHHGIVANNFSIPRRRALLHVRFEDHHRRFLVRRRSLVEPRREPGHAHGVPSLGRLRGQNRRLPALLVRAFDSKTQATPEPQQARIDDTRRPAPSARRRSSALHHHLLLRARPRRPRVRSRRPETRAAALKMDAWSASCAALDYHRAAHRSGRRQRSRHGEIEGGWINLDQFADLTGFDTVGDLLYGKTEEDRAASTTSSSAFPRNSSSIAAKTSPPASTTTRIRAKATPLSSPPGLMPFAPTPRCRAPVIRPTIGMHGFDPHLLPEMKASFFAAGPDLRAGKTVAPFDNVNLYPWMAHMLGLIRRKPMAA